jgi:hypothetical protein
VIAFEDVQEATWQMIELILSTPSLLEDCLAGLTRLADGAEATHARQAEALRALAHDFVGRAHSPGRLTLLRRLTALGDLEAVQWPFVRETLLRIRNAASLDTRDSRWTEVVETAFRD